MRILCLLLAMVTLMTPIYSSSSKPVQKTTTHTGIFNPSTHTLSNGLQIVLVPNHMAPVVSVGLVYKIGTADDPQAMHGLSHFLEHLMFKGTKAVPTDQFKKQIIARGGKINAYTTPDITVYTADIAIDHLDFLLKLEADRMENLAFDDKEVESELQVVLEERKMRMDNNPFGTAYEAMLKSIFWHHPYGIPPIGYDYHIRAYTTKAAREHYKKWYAPNNAILVVAGDITMDTLLPIVQQHFGGIASQKIPPRNRTPEPPHSGVELELKQKSPRISLTMTLWNYSAPNYLQGETKHFYPLEVLAQVLGGNTLSRLYHSLVEEQKLAVDANAHYNTDTLDPDRFTVSVTLAPGADPLKLRTAVGQHIQALVNQGISDEELENAKRDLIAALAFARDGNDSCVEAFTKLALGLSVEEIEAWPDRIRAVSKEQVQEAAKAVLGKGPVSSITVYNDRETAPSSADKK
jgi:zinc protease